MDRIPDHTVKAIRSDKQDGLSLKEIAIKYSISKTTASYYCRDLFTHPSRIYQTTRDVILRRSHLKKRYICSTCGKPTKSKNKMCAVCYHAARRNNAKPLKQRNKFYPCRECKINLIKEKNGMCRSCYLKLRTIRESVLNTPPNKPTPIKPKPNAKLMKLAHCPKSPTSAHHWIINSVNIGTCKYCHLERDMTTNEDILNTKSNRINHVYNL